MLVHLQQTHGRSTDGRLADHFSAVLREVFVPIVEPGMEQACQLSGLRIQPGEIRAFVEITMVARERQVFRRVLASVLARRDVFDVKRQRLLFLPQPAILAATRCALPDRLAQPGIHQPVFACASTRRALAWRIPINVLACT